MDDIEAFLKSEIKVRRNVVTARTVKTRQRMLAASGDAAEAETAEDEPMPF